MMQEKSTGFLIFRKDDEKDKKEYLLLNYPAGHWDYPKGHVEVNETEIETAYRELEEETGIKKEDVEVYEDFRETIDYIYKKGRDISHKEVVYFLGETEDKGVDLSIEHKGYTWLPYKEALMKLTFKNAKDLLKKAKGHLEGKRE